MNTSRVTSAPLLGFLSVGFPSVGFLSVRVLLVALLTLGVTAPAANASLAPSTPAITTASETPSQAPPESTGGFGISPGSILVEDALRGGSASSNVMILNESGRTQTFQLTTRGEVAEWVSFGEENEEVQSLTVVSEPGRQIARVAIDIPDTAQNGTYTGRINIAAIAANASDPDTVGVSFELTLSIVVNGEQRIAAVFSNLGVVATEIGRPVTIRTSVSNSGNVSLPLSITTEVLRRGALVETLSNATSPQSVDPAQSTDVLTVWDTTDALPGDYTIRSTAKAGSLDLGTKEATFRLSGAGSLSRSGKLTDFSMIGAPKLDQALGLLATFTNTGQVATNATLNVSLYKGDTLLARIKSKQGYVEPGQVIPFEVQTQALPSGTFRAVADVAFDGGSSPSKELSFRVDANKVSLGLALGVGGAFIAFGSLAFLVIRRRRPKARPSSSPTTAMSAGPRSQPVTPSTQPSAKVEPFIPERTGPRRP